MADESRSPTFRRRALKIGLWIALGVAAGAALFGPVWRCAACDGSGLATRSQRTQRDCSACGGKGRVALSRYLDQKGGTVWERDSLR